ncbi:hypothetical protein [Mycobacterium tuberculosis]|uniref:hypothetical protein n=1 Tax=Mycobacterium tuberculosis TaxID=1773 RepID=UPI001587823B|nr:hypothetical protein [Mycobacterium tuberculosis]
MRFVERKEVLDETIHNMTEGQMPLEEAYADACDYYGIFVQDHPMNNEEKEYIRKKLQV